MNYQVLITQQCNFNCSYCIQAIKSNITLTEDKIPSICDFIIEDFQKRNIGVESEIFLNLSGGEPLLHKNIIRNITNEFIKRTRSLNLNKPKFEISTNASLLSKEILDFLLQFEYSFFIGFDGKELSQNLNRVAKNDENPPYQKIVKNIDQISSKLSNKSLLTINMVITANNVNYLFENFLYIYYNFKSCNISMAIAYNTEWNASKIFILSKELKKLAQKYIDIIVNENNSIKINLFEKQIELNLYNTDLKKSRCGAGISTITIASDGNVYACGGFVGVAAKKKDVIIGNIYSGLINSKIEILQNKITKLNSLSDCYECKLKYRCRTYCPVENILASNKINQISSYQCEINKVLVFTADSIIEDLLTRVPQLFKKRYTENFF